MLKKWCYLVGYRILLGGILAQRERVRAMAPKCSNGNVPTQLWDLRSIHQPSFTFVSSVVNKDNNDNTELLELL